MPIEHPTVSCCSARSSQQSCWSRSGSEPNATGRAWPGQSAHLLCHSGRRGSRRLPFRERTKGSACVAYRGARPGRLRVVGGVAAVARTRRRTSQRPAPGARLAGPDIAAARRCHEWPTHGQATTVGDGQTPPVCHATFVRRHSVVSSEGSIRCGLLLILASQLGDGDDARDNADMGSVA
jgi:hypothetical protein